jgi:biotin operon repressor
MSDEDRTLDFDSPVLRRGFTAVPNALLENTALTLGARMTLISLMSFAWKGDPFPGQKKLGEMLGVTDRTIRDYLSELRGLEFLSVTQRGHGRTNIYRISSRRVLGAAEESSNGNGLDRKHSSGHDRKQGSAKEDEVKKTKELPAAAPRERNDIWDMLDHMFGPAATRSEETKRGKVVSSLKRAGATPEEMDRRAQNWPLWFENASLTETALESHWSKLARKPLRGARR